MAQGVRKTERTILHVDCNAFYASVECLYRPELRTLPVAVGGDAEKRHGIILAKNQQAKAFGVTTGEALWQARQKCPELVILPPDYGKYIRFSRLCREIYGEYSPQVESFGLDECWLDVTGTPRLADLGPRLLAEEIRERVKEELGITVSVGVSFNKIFAKLGSDFRKPDAVTVFDRGSMREKVWPIDVADLLYVGRATERKLRAFGIGTIGELARTPVEVLRGWFGKWGLMLHCFANGMDSSPVAKTGEESLIKSIGNSTTTPRDLTCEQDVSIIYWMLCESVAARLREGGFRCRTVQISLRTNDLFCFERQMKLPEPTCLASELHGAAMCLVRENYGWEKPLRSIGVRGTELLSAESGEQLSMFADAGLRERILRLERTMDEVRRRYGYHALSRASVLRDRTLANIDAKSDHVIHPVGYFKAGESI